MCEPWKHWRGKWAKRMMPPAKSQVDDALFDELVLAFDQRAVEGESSLDQAELTNVPAEMQQRLGAIQACLKLLVLAREPNSTVNKAESSENANLPNKLNEPSTSPVNRPERPYSFGDRIGRFAIDKEIGRGSGGLVFRAYDPEVQRWVALKIPMPGILTDAALRQRFVQEAQAAGGLSHPHIVPVFEAGEDLFLCYLVSELVRGPNLAVWLREQKTPISPQGAARLMVDLADAVEHAHSRGVLHRDIKPSNILLEPWEASFQPGREAIPFRARLADFGLAKVTAGMDLTASGSLLGTVNYMAPEQARGKVREIGPASDVYALGAVLYELLTGQTPLKGENHPDTLRRIVSDEPLSPRKLRRSIPRDLETICLKCLAKEPGQRYPSARVLEEDLRRFLDNRPIFAHPPSALNVVAKWMSRNPLLAGSLGLCSAAIVALLVVLLLFVHEQSAALVSAHKARSRDLLQMYPERMSAAEEHIRSGEPALARELLGAYETLETGIQDPRGPEWDFLWRQSQAPQPSRVFRHEAPIHSFDLSPDEKWLVSGDNQSRLQVWDFATGQLTRQVTAHQDQAWEIQNVRFIPHTDLVISSDQKGYVQFWRVGSWDKVAEHQIHDGSVHGLAMSADGQTIITGSREGKVKVWGLTDLVPKQEGTGGATANFKTPDPLHSFEMTGEVYAVDLAEDGRVAAGADDGLIIWDNVRLGPARHLLQNGWPYKLMAVRFANHGRQLVSTGWFLSGKPKVDNATAKKAPKRSVANDPAHVTWICETDSAVPLTGIPTPRFVGNTIAVSSDEQMVAIGGVKGEIELWRIPRGDFEHIEQTRFVACEGFVRALRFSRDGKRLISAGDNRQIAVWEIAALPRRLFTRHLIHSDNVNQVAYSADGSLLTTGSKDGTMAILESQTGRRVATLGIAGRDYFKAQLTQDKQTLFAMTEDLNFVEVWDVPSERQVRSLGLSANRLEDIALMPDGSAIAMTLQPPDRDWQVSLWDTRTGDQQRVLFTSPHRPFWICISPDGGQLAAGTAGGKLIIVNMRTYEKHEISLANTIIPVVFSPNGKQIAAANRLGQIYLIDAADGRVTWTYPATSTMAMNGLAISPDGRLLAVATGDGFVDCYHLANRQRLLHLNTAPYVPGTMEFSPDGNDLTVCLMDVPEWFRGGVLTFHLR